MKRQTCPHCGKTCTLIEIPTSEGEPYLFCCFCGDEIPRDELLDVVVETETETEDYKCVHCETTRPPTEMKEDGRTFLFCSVCKNELKLGDALDRTVHELKIDLDINVFYDEDKDYAMMTIKDWEKILDILNRIGTDLTVKDNRGE